MTEKVIRIKETNKKNMEEHGTFRCARREDTPLILYFIKALAAYEKMADEVVAA